MATQRNVDRYVQAEREELGDAAEDHDHRNHQVDDAAATRGDMSAWGSNSATAGGSARGGAWEAPRELRASLQAALSFFFPPHARTGSSPTHKLSEKSILAGAGFQAMQ